MDSPRSNNRCVEDLYQWDAQKRMKIEHERLKGQAELPEYSFEPHINKNSQKIAEKRKIDAPGIKPEDRLIQSGLER